jgi:murein DD-endopeptidase MepM/ murein hydrolase activator NlpD
VFPTVRTRVRSVGVLAPLVAFIVIASTSTSAHSAEPVPESSTSTAVANTTTTTTIDNATTPTTVADATTTTAAGVTTTTTTTTTANPSPGAPSTSSTSVPGQTLTTTTIAGAPSSTVPGVGTTDPTASSTAPATTSTTPTTPPTSTVPTTPTTVPDPHAVPVGGWPVKPIVFPVLGPVNYSDSWGDYRADIETHFHVGVDLLGVRLQPLVAASSGTISHLVVKSPTAGWGFVIKDQAGWEYRYYHVNNDAPGTTDNSNPVSWRLAPGLTEGSKVVAGQLVGYMGDSGDAVGNPHLHFEIADPTGTSMDPFPSVRAAESATRCSPPKGLGDLAGFVTPTDTDAEIVTVDIPGTDGSFTISANGTVFRVKSARNIGSALYNGADGPCHTA